MEDATPLLYDIALAFAIVTLITFILYKLNIQRPDTTQFDVAVANGEVNWEGLALLDEAHDAEGRVRKEQTASLNELIDLNSHEPKKEVDDEDIRRFWDGAVNAHLNVDQVKHRMAVIPTCVRSCIFNRIGDLGCAHNDYPCLCRRFDQLEDPAFNVLEAPVQDDFKVPELEDFKESVIDIPTELKPRPKRNRVRTPMPVFEFQKAKLTGRDATELRRDLPENSNDENPDTERFSECVELCANGVSLHDVPSQVLNFCEAVHEPAHLPEFMLKTLSIYGRAVTSGFSSGFIPAPLSTTPTRASTPTNSASRTPSSSSSYTALFTTTTYISLSPGQKPYTSTITGAFGLTVDVGFTGTVPQTSSKTSNSQPTFTSPAGLSTGAKIGIGVTIPLVVLIAIGVLAFCLLKRRKKRNAPTGDHPPELPEETSSRRELDSGAFVKRKEDSNAIEAGNGQIHELSQPQVAENDVHELKADSYAPVVSSLPVHEPAPPTPTPRYELTDTGVTTYHTPVPTAPPPAVTRKPVNPSPAPAGGYFPPPWETAEGEGSFSAAHTGPPIPSTQANEDRELREMEDEMARIKEEKDRLRRMQSLEVREKELRKTIEARKKGG